MSSTQRIREFNKAVFDVSVDSGKAVVEAVTDGATRALKTVRDTGATVAGQARAVVDRTASDVTSGAKQVAGQARAQGASAAEDLDTIAASTARKATAAVDPRPASGTPYEDWTRAELYERAKELDIDGRSTMSKRQLIAALRSN